MYSYTYKDFYKSYDGDISFKQFKQILMAVFKEVFEALFNGHQVSLPYRLGYLEMMKYKPNENTLAYRTLEEQENHHTDGYKVSLKWRKVAIRNVKLTRFNFVSTINKEIGRRLKADGSLIYNFNTI